MEWGLGILFSAIAFSAVLAAMPCTWPDVKQPSKRETMLAYYQRGGRKLSALLWH